MKRRTFKQLRRGQQPDHHHNVYVVMFDRAAARLRKVRAANPNRDPAQPCVRGYLVTALGTASFGLATAAWHVLAARAVAWLGRGVRTPIRKALLAASVTKETYGRAFGFERMMDIFGAIVGPASAFFLLQAVIPVAERRCSRFMAYAYRVSP
jgi:MFS family permease